MTERSGLLVSETPDVSGLSLEQLTELKDSEFTKCVGVVIRGSLVEVTQAVTETDAGDR